MTDRETARIFFENRETGKGWAARRDACHGDATFACQSDALAEVTTLAGYADRRQELLTPIPDGHYELTGRTIAADCAYVMTFEDAKIRNMTKIWNADYSLRQLGWA